MAKTNKRKREKRAMLPRSFTTYLDMAAYATAAGWTGRKSTEERLGGLSDYIHETPIGDFRMMHADVMVVRMIHFSCIPCGLFHPKTLVFCVTLLGSGEIEVHRHLVGECERSHYNRLNTAPSVRGVRALRRGIKIRERNKS